MPATRPFSPVPPPSPVSTASAEPREFLLPRDGDRDLAFSGWLIGYAEDSMGPQPQYGGSTRERGVRVAIFATEKGAIVIQACRWEVDGFVDGTSTREDDCSVKTFPKHDPDEALRWLKKDAGGKLGPTSKQAWTQACRNWEDLREQEVERA